MRSGGTLPGFTAARSLRGTGSYFRGRTTAGAGSAAVTPQFSVTSIFRALTCGACAAAVLSPVPGDELALCTLCARLAISD